MTGAQAKERLSPARRGDRPCPTRPQPTNPLPTAPASTRKSPTRSSPSLNRATCPGSSHGRRRAAPLGLPKNAATGRAYSGINILILWMACTERGFSGQNWLTFRQALKIGAHVRKGERGTTVVYADRFVPYRERDARHTDRRRARGDPVSQALHGVQCRPVRGCTGRDRAACGAAGRQPDPAAGRGADRATGADIRIGGNRAFYVPTADYIQVPPPSAFFEPINWHRTVFHELGHHSGHPSRLNRDLSGDFGSSSYAREELVAEMTGAFVCAALSIVPTVRHADYLANWLEVLREDNRAIIRAASAASKAADYLLAFRIESAPATLRKRQRDAAPPSPPRCRRRSCGTAREGEGRKGFCDGFSRARDSSRPPVTGRPQP